jgi:hypothetical protein
MRKNSIVLLFLFICCFSYSQEEIDFFLDKNSISITLENARIQGSDINTVKLVKDDIQTKILKEDSYVLLIDMNEKGKNELFALTKNGVGKSLSINYKENILLSINISMPIDEYSSKIYVGDINARNRLIQIIENCESKEN